MIVDIPTIIVGARFFDLFIERARHITMVMPSTTNPATAMDNIPTVVNTGDDDEAAAVSSLVHLEPLYPGVQSHVAVLLAVSEHRPPFEHAGDAMQTELNTSMKPNRLVALRPVPEMMICTNYGTFTSDKCVNDITTITDWLAGEHNAIINVPAPAPLWVAQPLGPLLPSGIAVPASVPLLQLRARDGF